MAKVKYVEDSYIEKVEHYIYNNLNITDLYDVSQTVEYFTKEQVEKILKPGEKYNVVPDYEHVIVTSYARFINMVKLRQYSIRLVGGNVQMYISGQKIILKDLFEKFGWEYNMDKIKQGYDKYNWQYLDYDKYHKKY